MNRTSVIVIAVCLFLVAFVSLPAQGPPSGAGPAAASLAAQVAALQARVDKLEGNIVASDLVGTYSVTGLGTDMSAFRLGPPLHNATISTTAFRGTLRLNADGTGNGLASSCEGSTLTQGSWAMNGFDCSEPLGDVTWTYENGVITITFLSDGDVIPFNVALGGRFMIFSIAPFHDAPFFSSDQFVIIATRLR